MTASGWAELAKSNDPFEVWVGESKPSLSLETIDRSPFELQPTADGIVLVHFFATWCEPCREEIPSLGRLVRRTPRGKLTVVAVAVADTDTKVRRFVEANAVNFPVLIDRDRSTARAWSVSALPTTVILDAKLQPRLFIARDYEWDNFDPENAFANSANNNSITKEGKP